ncbi:MAG: hypothetical protein WC269_01420 [Candidatus Gracilibacteria bacterium]|jgi:hypothetical protein
MKKIINDTLAFFEQKKRDNGDAFYILKTETPQELRDSVRASHGERLPNNWIYEKYHDILDAFSGYTIESPDDLEKNRAEIVDDLVDVYTSDLTAWLNESPHNIYFIDEAREEYGPSDDAFKCLQMAQYKAIDDIASYVVSYLADQIS